ncbi:response regulator transcription factor [Arthrobacter sp. H20]|uniref:response regulator transcription factor n=1 Tax=Arthrobacter sp. H20 TaxID=1267981 RepID=UPI0004B07C48|nr:response regulator transcription factor [Arthrobacter sp. H20]
MISVVIVDDERLVRSGFEALLSSDAEIEVVGTAETGDDALRVVRREKPDVVLMDIRMPGRDGVSATAAITADPALSATKVIVLTTFDVDEYVSAALRAGASGFLLKDARPTELLAAMHTVARGDSVLSPTLLCRLMAAFVQTSAVPAPPAWMATLTPREAEVLSEVARGLSNTEIGGALHMSAATAKTHVGRLLTKLRARDRTQLVIAAYEAGLVERSLSSTSDMEPPWEHPPFVMGRDDRPPFRTEPGSSAEG